MRTFSGSNVEDRQNAHNFSTHCTPLPNANRVVHSGFETQRRRHQKSKLGVSVAPQKGLMSSKIKKNNSGKLV